MDQKDSSNYLKLRIVVLTRRLAKGSTPVPVGINPGHSSMTQEVFTIAPCLSPHAIHFPGVDVAIRVHRHENGEDKVLQHALHITLTGVSQQCTYQWASEAQVNKTQPQFSRIMTVRVILEHCQVLKPNAYTTDPRETPPCHLVPAIYNTVDVAIHSREWMPPSRKMHGFSAELPASLISRTLEGDTGKASADRCSISKIP